MSNEIDEWKKLWQQGKLSVVPENNSRDIQLKATAKKRSSLYAQYSTVGILAATIVMVYAFFIILYPYKHLLSNIGIWIMIGSLAIRIAIELYSIARMKKITITDSAVNNTEYTIKYYTMRKTIHGIVTYIIVALYTTGFYLIIPEFSKHVPAYLSIFLCALYPVGAIILITQIRKGIKKEIRDIADLIQLQQQLEE